MQKTMTKPAITHWIFDLDNTLYPPAVRLFDQIEVKMEEFIMRELALDLNAAKSVRADFWQKYGTTLAGLMDVHNIDPDPFLYEVHDIDVSDLTPDPDLADSIAQLPGQKVIFTNGSRGHGVNISTARGIHHAFDAIFGIEDPNYVPKPHLSAFEAIIEKAGINPTQAMMIEDDPRNLEVPAALGMTTVLMGPHCDRPHVHHHAEDLAQFLRAFPKAA